LDEIIKEKDLKKDKETIKNEGLSKIGKITIKKKRNWWSYVGMFLIGLA